MAQARPAGRFHEGELDVQRRAGVRDEAARLVGMLGPARLQGAAGFLADRTFAVLCARDRDGLLWVSPLTGPPGFLEVAGPTTLAVHTVPVAGDPLRELTAGQAVGLIVIEFATRRRMRVNGLLSAVTADGLTIDADQAYGNCPQYIRRRTLVPDPPERAVTSSRHSTGLTADDVALIRRADTAFVGTTHPTRGTDASHRGGPPGFLRVEGSVVHWPDYSGNNMFNTLGNLAVDPSAALLVPDLATGQVAAMSGIAVTDWNAGARPGDDGDTGRGVRFTVEHVVAGHLLPWHAGAVEPSEFNPPLTD